MNRTLAALQNPVMLLPLHELTCDMGWQTKAHRPNPFHHLLFVNELLLAQGHQCPSTCVLSVSVFMLQEQSCIDAVEAVWSAESESLTILPL
jgi:hypothetical protein